MFCQNCGEQNTPESKYCGNCGAALTETGAPVAVPAKRKTSGLAIAALVLGLIGFFINILGILAIIFGAVALGQTGRDSNDHSFGE